MQSLFQGWKTLHLVEHVGWKIGKDEVFLVVSKVVHTHSPIIPHCSYVGFCSGSAALLLFFLISIFFVVLKEEVVAGDGEGPHKDDELCEVHLSIIVWIQITHNFLYCIFILCVLSGMF